MKKKAILFAASVILMAASQVASADCVSNTGHISTISFMGAQPYFSLLEYPSSPYIFDPTFTPENRRILLNMLNVAIMAGFTVEVVCNPTRTYIEGVLIKAN
ncbi:hypothetical protein [Pandoraea pulmonicola]|uniref:Uncharacterized protein n=1 Tax=Pandoraea pulmonicola TaxID=93221 RepID=A0AAJ4Z9J7_PANPU|nr:hypothetical protein [Pandoraea pulmonicola]AJC21793.1 hypothetical protein RO07_17235 [Pandoraea pulmonicola]SUA89308.1 Uncharacterised protein [Pandoraea pulmonicola]